MTLRTEFNFTLPRGYVDGNGSLHREGVMRLATANDEIAPMKDPRVQANPGYLVVILLSRVVRLGDLPQVNPKIIEDLFAADFAYLEEFSPAHQRERSHPHSSNLPRLREEI